MAAKIHSPLTRDPDPGVWILSGSSIPVDMLKNPVMFVCEVGAAITTAGLIVRADGETFGFGLQIALWLWFTVLFANFAEAMAEGRGKAQANALRKTRTQTMASRLCTTVRRAGYLRRNNCAKANRGGLGREMIPGGRRGDRRCGYGG